VCRPSPDRLKRLRVVLPGDSGPCQISWKRGEPFQELDKVIVMPVVHSDSPLERIIWEAKKELINVGKPEELSMTVKVATEFFESHVREISKLTCFGVTSTTTSEVGAPAAASVSHSVAVKVEEQLGTKEIAMTSLKTVMEESLTFRAPKDSRVTYKYGVMQRYTRRTVQAYQPSGEFQNLFADVHGSLHFVMLE
jgi:hypothetical protein